MDTIDFNQTLPSGITFMLQAGGFLAVSIFLVMFIVIKKRWKGRMTPFFLGLTVFAFVRIFVMLTESALALIPSVDIAFSYNPIALTIVDCLLCAAGYVAGRIVLCKVLEERFERKGDIYLGGLGLGFGDALLYGFTVVSYFVWCIGIEGSGLEAALSEISGEELIATYQSISDLFVAPVILWLFMGVSTVIDMILQMALMTVTFGIEKKTLPSMFHGICFVINVVSVITFQIYDVNSITSISILFAVKLIIFAVVVYYIFNVVGKKVQYEE